MTTIVAIETPEGVTFASDTRAAGGSLNDGWIAKVFTNGKGTIGVAGYLRVAQMVRYAEIPDAPKSNDPDKVDRWVMDSFVPVWLQINREFGDGDSKKQGASEALIAVNGRVYELEPFGAWTRSGSGVYAIGSGYKYALGALEVGASAKKAVKIASKYDSYTNSDVRTIKIET